MKIFKKLLLSSLLFCGYAYGMDPGQSVHAGVKTFLLPEHEEIANDEFLKLLKEAKNEVLVAIYWITDDYVVDRIIEVKKRGVNVQIIFDESTGNRDKFMWKFLRNDITPIIFPSEFTSSLMHNKFLVIDGFRVWTGSANFTKKAFDPDSKDFNYENIVVIESDKVAKNYLDGFYSVKVDAVNFYIKILMEDDNPLNFIKKISSNLYKDDSEFKKAIQEEFCNGDNVQKARLQNHFPDLVQQSFRPPTDNQIYFLQARGLYRHDMSFDEASQLIGKLKRNEVRRPVSSQKSHFKTPSLPKKPATKWQKDFLKARGYDASRMSYDEAYELVAQFMN